MGSSAASAPPEWSCPPFGLPRENPDPDEAAIRAGIEGNLCRCTGYQTIVESVRWAAAHGGVLAPDASR